MTDDAVEGVLFDLDGTICLYSRSSDELLSVAFDRVGVEPLFTGAAYYRRFEEFATDGDDVTAIRSRAFAALAEENGADPAVGRSVASAFADERDHSNVEFLPGAAAALEATTDAYPVGLVTNGDPEMQRAKLRGLGIADAFDLVVYGGHDVPAKPDPAPFERALSTLDLAPGRVVHVGNSPTSDVAGARAAGIRSVLVAESERDPGDGPGPDWTVESMSELVEPPWRGRA